MARGRFSTFLSGLKLDCADPSAFVPLEKVSRVRAGPRHAGVQRPAFRRVARRHGDQPATCALHTAQTRNAGAKLNTHQVRPARLVRFSLFHTHTHAHTHTHTHTHTHKHA